MVVSLKTVNTNSSNWAGNMKEHINKLGKEDSVLINGLEPTKVLDIRVQPGGKALAESALKEFAGSKGVILKVTEFDPILIVH